MSVLLRFIKSNCISSGNGSRDRHNGFEFCMTAIAAMAAKRNLSYKPFMVRARHILLLSAVAAAAILGGCSKHGGDKQPGQAFLDSQIPSGLSPQYFPPQGFVWGGYRAKGLPEARYGVASPPINPRAQVLIMADADYPAEAYFERANQLINAGYGVWLFEAPGQGGSGHYLMQNQSVFTKNYHDGQLAALSFIRDVIKPDAAKPLFIVGTGYSAIDALALSTQVKNKAYAGFVAYSPYLGGEIARGNEWHREDTPATYWGGIAQNWQMSNPDLRLRVKSETWRTQMQKAYTDLNALHLPVVSISGQAAPVLLIEPKDTPTAAANQASALCAHIAQCKVQATSGPETLGTAITDFIRDALPIR
jgi:alpha-beta hydrolase superfamily lysophospholipase